MLQYQFLPLTDWPGPITQPANRRSRHTFRAGWDSTLSLLTRELTHLDGTNVVIQADVARSEIRRDGMLRARASVASPRIRLLFESKYGPLSYQADSCEYWQHNVRSIALGLEALRAVDRYGIGAVPGQQYKGYLEITAGAGEADSAAAARVTIAEAAGGIDLAATPLRTAVKVARRRTHPDANGGDRAKWDAVAQAAHRLGVDPNAAR